MFLVVFWSASLQATPDTPTSRRSGVPFRTHLRQCPLSSRGYTRHDTSTPRRGVQVLGAQTPGAPAREHESSGSTPRHGEPWWLLWVQMTVHRFR
jgi:hypothetical protein